MKFADTGLRRQPFKSHGKPIVLVPYASQQAAIRFLNETRFNDHGLALFHGPSLSGKTSAIQRFAELLPDDYAVAVVDGAGAEPAALLKKILGQYGYGSGFDSASECFSMIRVFARHQAAGGQAPLLIIENAHAMNPVLLEMLCELAEMEVGSKSALRIVLVSDRPMVQIVEAPAMQTISKRLTGKFLLRPLTRAEAANYVYRKLESGGCRDPRAMVPPAVCDRLHSASGGWPGLMDRMAMLAIANAERFPLCVDHVPECPALTESPTDTPQLILTFRHRTLKKIELAGQRLLIGRNELCDLRIDGEWISRHHAILFRNGQSTIVVDMKSKNGTYVNGKRVSKQLLVNDDIVGLGDHRLKYVDKTSRQRTSLRRAGWDDTTIARSIRDFRDTFAQQLRSGSAG